MPSFSFYHGGVICLPSPHDFLLHVLNTQLNVGVNLSFKFHLQMFSTKNGIYSHIGSSGLYISSSGTQSGVSNNVSSVMSSQGLSMIHENGYTDCP